MYRSGAKRRRSEATEDANPDARTISERPVIAVFEEAVEYGAHAAAGQCHPDGESESDTLDHAEEDKDNNDNLNLIDIDDMVPVHRNGSNQEPSSMCERQYSLCPLSAKEIMSYIESILIVLKGL